MSSVVKTRYKRIVPLFVTCFPDEESENDDAGLAAKGKPFTSEKNNVSCRSSTKCLMPINPMIFFA